MGTWDGSLLELGSEGVPDEDGVVVVDVHHFHRHGGAAVQLLLFHQHIPSKKLLKLVICKLM